MAMHELEDLVEMAVKRLSRSGASRHRLRSLYFNLFELEARFDTSFTHFRTMGELLAARFVYCLAPSEHPSFAAAPGYFEGLEGFCFIEPPVPGAAPDGSYFKAPYLYCDAGSPLWRRLVELGRLGGSDAEPPEVMSAAEVLEEVARAAEAVGDVRLVAYAYRLLCWDLLDVEPEEVAAEPAVRALRDIVRRTRALELPLHFGALRDPTPADLEDSPLLRFWFDLGAEQAALHRPSGTQRIAPVVDERLAR
jgi:hypothetical protein